MAKQTTVIYHVLEMVRGFSTHIFKHDQTFIGYSHEVVYKIAESSLKNKIDYLIVDNEFYQLNKGLILK